MITPSFALTGVHVYAYLCQHVHVLISHQFWPAMCLARCVFFTCVNCISVKRFSKKVSLPPNITDLTDDFVNHESHFNSNSMCAVLDYDRWAWCCS